MTTEADAAAMVQTIQENAKRLGVSWDLTMATVLDGSDSSSISAVFDANADTNVPTQGLISTIGAVAPGARVYVLQLPPAGNYIIGLAEQPGLFYARKTVAELTAAASTVIFFLPPNLREVDVTFNASGSDNNQLVDLRMRVNGVATGNYISENVQGNGAAASASLIDNLGTSAHIGFIPGAASAGNWGPGKVWFPGWDQGNAKRATWLYQCSSMSSGGVLHVGGGTMTAVQTATGLNRLDFVPSVGLLSVGSDFQIKGVFA